MGRPNRNGDVGADREAHYGSLLDEQEASGLSVAGFAEEVGLSAATLYSWRRRLGRGTRRGNGVALLEVRVDEEEDGLEGSGRMTIEIADGTRIELEPDFDGAALERLLCVLDRC